MIAYRVGRAVLAGAAVTALALFAAWRLLLWRMAEVYKLDNQTPNLENRSQ